MPASRSYPLFSPFPSLCSKTGKSTPRVLRKFSLIIQTIRYKVIELAYGKNQQGRGLFRAGLGSFRLRRKSQVEKWNSLGSG